jgi:integrase
MKATSLEAQAEAIKIVPLAIQPKPAKRPARVDSRFKIQSFTNPRTGSESWRVTGIKRDGGRVRENHSDAEHAKSRQIELETEYAQGHTETGIKATTLNTEQLRLCEGALVQLGDDWMRMIDAVTYWQQNGKQRAAIESPRIDEATEKYLDWLKASTFRDATKQHWKTRINIFRNSVTNMRTADVTTEIIQNYLDRRGTSASGKDTDRRAISRFFSWCIESERRWAIVNPCRGVKKGERGEVEAVRVLSIAECKALLAAAEQGGLAPYVAICLFGGLRPEETARLQWESVNLTDMEIRLAANQVKTGRTTGRGRTVAINPTLAAWLKAHKDTPIYPANWRKRFDVVKRAAGFGTPTEKMKHLKPWPHDVMRHTAISHFFRDTGSYGRAADQFGNSEAIIKKHYDGRVSSADAKQFYAIKPAKKGEI